jgi:hypothetical protein
LKPEWWGSPLVQEKYREEEVCDKRHNNNNNNNILTKNALNKIQKRRDHKTQFMKNITPKYFDIVVHFFRNSTEHK